MPGISISGRGGSGGAVAGMTGGGGGGGRGNFVSANKASFRAHIFQFIRRGI